MNLKGKIELPFKGSRDYLHGTDILNAIYYILEANMELSEILDFKMFITKMSRLQFSYVVQEATEKLDHEKVIFVKASFNYQGRAYLFLLFEDGREVNERVEFDESIVSQKSIIKDQSIELEKETGFTAIENIVVLNKNLLTEVLPDTKGKWVFTRLDISNLSKVNHNALYSLRFVRNSNFRLVLSDIYLSDEKVGSIYFSLI